MSDVVSFQAKVKGIRWSSDTFTIMSVILIDSDHNLSEDFTKLPEIIVTGSFPLPELGSVVKIQGASDCHRNYGWQIKDAVVSLVLPETESTIINFLASKHFYQIGKKTASRIVAKYGLQTLSVLTNYPEQVAKECKIKKAVAMRASAYLQEHTLFADLFRFLSDKGFGGELINKIFARYGGNAITLIAENPYRMIEEIRGVGFEKADNLATKLGFAPASAFRQRAIVHHVLRLNLSKGSTWMLPQEFVKQFVQLSGLETPSSEELVKLLSQSDAIWLKMAKGRTGVTLRKWLTMVVSATAKLEKMLSHAPDIDMHHISGGDLEKMVTSLAQSIGLELGGDQQKALEIALKHPVALITGGPGTGKTTILRTITECMKKHSSEVILLAPTGRAAKRLAQSTQCEASTIHRYLFSNMSQDDASLEDDVDLENFLCAEMPFCAKEKLKARCFIVDEFSMVDIFLFAQFLSLLKPGDRLVMIGDANQLPSIGGGAVLRDLIQSNLVPKFELRELFRQAKDSLIVRNANAVLTGVELLSDNAKLSEFRLIESEDTEKVITSVIELFTSGKTAEYGVFSPQDIQVLTPYHKTDWGTEVLNKRLQDAFNGGSGQSLTYFDRTFKVGDRVIMTKNRYDLPWRDTSNQQEGLGVMNGDMGSIVAVVEADDALSVEFDDGKLVKFEGADISQLQLGYAISIHKSQGSEYKMAIIFLPNHHYNQLLTRNLLYTAITRAKGFVRIFAKPTTVRTCLRNKVVEKRLTLLSLVLDRQLDLASLYQL